MDGNGLLDILGVTVGSGLVRYEIGNSTNFRIMWGTGKGSYERHGEAPPTVRTGTARFSSVIGNGDYGGAGIPKTSAASVKKFAVFSLVFVVGLIIM